MLSRILLLIAAVTAPQSMTMEEVDREILTIVEGARFGFLFHGPTHNECGISSRRRALEDRGAQYRDLENEFVELGGVLPTDHEIVTETIHYRCRVSGSKGTAEWEAAMRRIDDKLGQMKALVARKRQLRRD
jgi:hypothetical protein